MADLLTKEGHFSIAVFDYQGVFLLTPLKCYLLMVQPFFQVNTSNLPHGRLDFPFDFPINHYQSIVILPIKPDVKTLKSKFIDDVPIKKSAQKTRNDIS